MGFTERFLKAMEKRAMTKEQVAVESGLSAEAIRSYMTGHRRPGTIDILARVSRALGVSIDWLLGLTDVEPDWAQKRPAPALPERSKEARMPTEDFFPVKARPTPDGDGQDGQAQVPLIDPPRPVEGYPDDSTTR